MTEDELRSRLSQLQKSRDELQEKLQEVNDELHDVNRLLLPFSKAQKKLSARLINGVDERKLAQTKSALSRAVQASDLHASGMSWKEVGNIMGLTHERARQIGISRKRLEDALGKRK